MLKCILTIAFEDRSSLHLDALEAVFLKFETSAVQKEGIDSST